VRRRQRDQGLRLILAEHGRQLLELAEGVGDKGTAATMRVHVADLESGRQHHCVGRVASVLRCADDLVAHCALLGCIVSHVVG
jgi:hypothetical protein